MEIDIFPLPSTKGANRYIGIAFLGLIIITYIVGAYKLAQQLIGEDKELLCFLAAILLFIGGYAVLILLLHGIKQCLYAYFKHNRQELNNRIDRDPRGRTITVAYLAIIDAYAEVRGQDDAAKAQWFPIDALPPLAFDHEDIMRDAIALYKKNGIIIVE